jgi:hypothetical protein
MFVRNIDSQERSGSRFKGIRLMLLLAAAGTVLTLGACQRQSAQGTGQGTTTYSTDGYMGLTNANPNFPTNESYHTYDDDVRVMEEALKQIPGISSSTITINGPKAVVRINVPPQTNDADMERVRLEAQRRLTLAMPRYSVQVSASQR